MNLFRIFDLHMGAVTAATMVATWLCITYDVRADLPSELIAIAVVFPTAFGIGAAHRRREEALAALAELRAMIASLYYGHRDWVRDDPSHGRRGAELGLKLYRAVCTALSCSDADRSTARAVVSETFSDFSGSIEAMKRSGVPGSETSRANQYLNLALRASERLRTIAEYRTAGSLRLFSKLFLNLLPLAFAPAYAHVASESAPIFGYAVALAFALILVGLDNIQDGLEDPFDGVGEDDVRLSDDDAPFWLGRAPFDEVAS